MNTDRRRALVALTIAGLLWGSTVPLSKIALTWLPPGWLTAIRFAVAAAVLLAVTRPRGRAAWSPKVLAWGAAGYGGTVLLQNTGITRTSVSHAALLIGTIDHDGVFTLTVTASTKRPIKLSFKKVPGMAELREAILQTIPDGLYHDDIHGKPFWRKHMTLRLACEIRNELA